MGTRTGFALPFLGVPIIPSFSDLSAFNRFDQSDCLFSSLAQSDMSSVIV